MATTIEKLNIIKKVKQDIKTAIQKKGIEVGNIPFSQYANKIDQIPEIKAGYVQIANNVMTVHNITDNTASAVNKLYITDTNVSEPNYTEARLTKQLTFYQCDSIDTTNKTWTGYKWILLSSAYVKQDTLTTDLLTYDKVIPVVGNSYSSDALIKVGSFYNGMPTDGLIFYAPFNANTEKTWTDNDISYIGGASFENYQGIDCMHLNGSNYVKIQNNLDFNQSNTFTFSIWINYDTQSKTAFDLYDSINNKSQTCYVFYTNGQNCFRTWNTLNPVTLNTWHHFLFTYNASNTERKIYWDNVLKETFTGTIQANITNQIFIGWTHGLYSNKMPLYTAGWRIYDRILTSDERQLLFNQFNIIN